MIVHEFPFKDSAPLRFPGAIVEWTTIAPQRMTSQHGLLVVKYTGIDNYDVVVEVNVKTPVFTSIKVELSDRCSLRPDTSVCVDVSGQGARFYTTTAAGTGVDLAESVARLYVSSILGV